MRKILTLICATIITAIYAQIPPKKVHRFTYQLTYKIDSLNLNDVRNAIFFLDIDDKKSRFGEREQLMRDSTLYAVDKGGNAVSAFSMIGKAKPRFGYTIFRNASTEEMIHLEKISTKSFYYTETGKKINWKIEGETKKIDNLNCQKATTKLFGREWIAWFTTEIPFSAEPYKFYGLPGLIIDLQDAKQQYVFNLIQSNTPKVLFQDEIPKRAVKTTKEIFVKSMKDFKSNPNLDIPGISLDPAAIAAANKNLRERIKRENNPLELKPFE